MWVGGIAAVVGIDGDVAGKACAVVLVVLVVLVALSDRRDRLTAALVGAVAVQALLRGSSFGFFGLPTLVGIAALTPLVWTGWALARRRERRRAVVVVLVLAALVLVLSAGAALAAVQARDLLRPAPIRPRTASSWCGRATPSAPPTRSA